ncbi:MAG: CopG family antitoxin [Caldilinea sp.]
MKPIPEFSTDEELAAWVDTHDTAEYLDELEDVNTPFQVRLTRFATRLLDVRLRADLYAAIEEVAERRGIPYQMLVQRWLAEKVQQEAPDLAVPQ